MSAQFIREPIRAYPNPMDAVMVYRAQSILTKDGRIGPTLSPADAARVVRAAERGEKPRVTVPQPLPRAAVPPADAQTEPQRICGDYSEVVV